MSTKKALRACTIVGVVVAAAIAGVFIVRGIMRYRRRERCASYLKSVSGAICWSYANHNGGRFPSDLGALFPDYVSDAEVFLCRNAGHAVRFTNADLSAGAKDASGLLGPKHTDYGYVSGLTKAREGDWVLLFDKTPHPGGIRNIARAGGVETISEEQFKQALATTLREARAVGFSPGIWGYAPGETPLD